MGKIKRRFIYQETTSQCLMQIYHWLEIFLIDFMPQPAITLSDILSPEATSAQKERCSACMTLIWSGITQYLAKGVGCQRVWKDVLTAPHSNGAGRREVICLNPIFANVGGILWIILAEMKPLLSFFPCLGEVNSQTQWDSFSQKAIISGAGFSCPFFCVEKCLIKLARKKQDRKDSTAQRLGNHMGNI